MLKTELIVSNELGLHARAAAQLVKCLSAFDSSVAIKRPDLGLSVDAKSILSILTLAATKGTVLEISIDGEDEKDAMTAIERSFASGFSENRVQPS
jgi:phosphotransferase system HPr (HPr) family protein